MQYLVLAPDGQNYDITARVVRGLAQIQEIAFGLERTTTPSAGRLEVDNSTGFFERSGETIFSEEITDYALRVQDTLPTGVVVDIFVGFIDDVETQGGSAFIVFRSVIAEVIQASLPVDGLPLTYSGTPAGFVQFLLTEKMQIPSLFVDSIELSALDAAESLRGILIDVNIPPSDRLTVGTILQELYNVTGLYVYSDRGVIRGARLGAFGGKETEDFVFDRSMVIAGKTKKRQPKEWQKTYVEVPSRFDTTPVATGEIDISGGVAFLNNKRSIFITISPFAPVKVLFPSLFQTREQIIAQINNALSPVVGYQPASLDETLRFIVITGTQGGTVTIDVGTLPGGDAYDVIWSTTSPAPFVVESQNIIQQFALKMSDISLDGEAIIDRFREKPLVTDGAGNKILHQNEDSAAESMADILGWRGFPRYDIETQISTNEPINRARLQSAALFNIVRIEWETGCVRGVLVQKTQMEGTARVRVLSISDPVSLNPGLIRHPVVRNIDGYVILRGQLRQTLVARLGEGAWKTYEVGQSLPAIIIDNPAQKPFYYKVASTPDPECEAFDRLHRVESEIKGCFIAGVSKGGDPTCLVE